MELAADLYWQVKPRQIDHTNHTPDSNMSLMLNAYPLHTESMCSCRDLQQIDLPASALSRDYQNCNEGCWMTIARYSKYELNNCLQSLVLIYSICICSSWSLTYWLQKAFLFHSCPTCVKHHSRDSNHRHEFIKFSSTMQVWVILSLTFCIWVWNLNSISVSISICISSQFLIWVGVQVHIYVKTEDIQEPWLELRLTSKFSLEIISIWISDWFWSWSWTRVQVWIIWMNQESMCVVASLY